MNLQHLAEFVPRTANSCLYEVTSLPSTWPVVKMDEDDLRFYIHFNSISVILGRCLDDNERLCAMELHLQLRRFHFK